MAASLISETASRRLVDLISLVDNVPFSFDTDWSPFYRFFIAPDSRPHGFIHPDTVANLPWPPVFTISHEDRSVTLSPPPTDSTSSSSASKEDTAAVSAYTNAQLQAAVDAAIASNAFPTLNGLHSEPFRILGVRHFAQVERFAAPLFGIATRGAHLTAYVRDSSDDQQLRIWVARRSPTLFTYPGMLDSTVAGGVKAPDSLRQCIVAEAAEEASLPESLVDSPRLRATGVVTLANRSPRTGLFHGEVLHTYDLELPTAVQPSPSDGEVDSFELMSCAEVRRRMLDGEFKPNVCAVMIDFLVRHGYITPETEGEAAYVEICARLRRRLPIPTGPD